MSKAETSARYRQGDAMQEILRWSEDREHERLIVCRTRDIGLNSAPELTALGESAMELTTAQLLYRDLLDWLHDKGSQTRTISTEEVKICRAKAATLVRLCGTAAKRLQDNTVETK